MSGIDDVAGVQITSNTVFPKGADFETVMLVCSHAFWPERARFLSSPGEAEAAGVPTSHPIHKALTAARRNPLKPKGLVIGRRLLPSTQIVKLTPVKLEVGYVYSFTVVTADGVEHPIEATVETGDDAADMADKIQAELDPLAGFVPVSATGVVTCTATAGLLIEYKDLPPVSDMTFQDTSTDPGIATDLAAIKTAADLAQIGFFGITLDHNAEAIINSARAWVDATKYFAIFASTDSGVPTAMTTTDVASDAKTASSKRCFVVTDQQSNQSYIATQLMCEWLTGNLPGTSTIAHKTLVGQPLSKYTEAEKNAIEAKNATWYADLGGLPATFEGHTPDGGWADLVIGDTWIASRIQVRVYAWIRGAKIRAYTDKSIKALCGEILAALAEGVQSGFLSDERPPTVTALKVTDIPPDVRASRRLTNAITWEAYYSNAIHGMTCKGTIYI